MYNNHQSKHFLRYISTKGDHKSQASTGYSGPSLLDVFARKCQFNGISVNKTSSNFPYRTGLPLCSIYFAVFMNRSLHKGNSTVRLGHGVHIYFDSMLIMSPLRSRDEIDEDRAIY